MPASPSSRSILDHFSARRDHREQWHEYPLIAMVENHIERDSQESSERRYYLPFVKLIPTCGDPDGGLARRSRIACLMAGILG